MTLSLIITSEYVNFDKKDHLKVIHAELAQDETKATLNEKKGEIQSHRAVHNRTLNRLSSHITTDAVSSFNNGITRILLLTLTRAHSITISASCKLLSTVKME